MREGGVMLGTGHRVTGRGETKANNIHIQYDEACRRRNTAMDGKENGVRRWGTEKASKGRGDGYSGYLSHPR